MGGGEALRSDSESDGAARNNMDEVKDALSQEPDGRDGRTLAGLTSARCVASCRGASQSGAHGGRIPGFEHRRRKFCSGPGVKVRQEERLATK